MPDLDYDLIDVFIELLEMEEAGLLQRVTRPDGQDGWILTPAFAEAMEFQRQVLGPDSE